MSQRVSGNVYNAYNVFNILNALDTSGDIPGAIRKTKSIVEESGSNFYQGASPILDARVLHAASSVVVACATNSTNSINTYDSYLVASHMRSNPDYWEYLYPREAPVISYLQGTLNTTPVQKPTVVRTRVEKQQAKPVRNPDKVASIQNPIGETTEAVQKMYGFLKKKYRRTPCSYFHLVLDPTSFTRTVENIYNFAFLVKDGLVAIFINEEIGLPYFRMNEGDERKNTPEDEKEHFIDSIDMRHWKEMVEALQITKPMITL